MSDIIYQDIKGERARRDATWGNQKHDLGIWMTILTEEVGEACKEVLSVKSDETSILNLRRELIHVAAVAVQIVEKIDEDEEAM